MTFSRFRILFGTCLLMAGLTIPSLQAAPDFDLTPLLEVDEHQGFQFESIRFRQGNQSVHYPPPFQWTWVKQGDRLHFTPSDAPQSGMTWSVVSNEGLPPLDVENPGFYQEWVLGNLPDDASDVEILRVGRQPVHMEGFPSMEVLVSYAAFGQNFRRVTYFINAGDDQLRVALEAPGVYFEDLNRLARQSLNRMSWE